VYQSVYHSVVKEKYVSYSMLLLTHYVLFPIKETKIKYVNETLEVYTRNHRGAQAQFFGRSNKLENETIFLSSSARLPPIRGKGHRLAVNI
jgi:hypothetical protein